VYQPHQNIRQHQIKQDYANCFDLADQLFWLPTFLSREDPNLEILTPEYLTKFVKNTPTNIANLDVDLEKNLLDFWQKDYLILFFGAGDVDNWAREFVSKNFVEN
jgi:UDP-N-acetylmuramate--alanine ligase